jgi:hypothetical protein
VMAEQQKSGRGDESSSVDNAGKPAPRVDVDERAGQHTGNPQVLGTRLFMQLQVFDCALDCDPTLAIERIATELARREAKAVLYEDVNAARGIGVLTWSEDPADFVTRVRPSLLAVAGLVPRTEFAMFGRTYATGYEPDLRFWLLERPGARASSIGSRGATKPASSRNTARSGVRMASRTWRTTFVWPASDSTRTTTTS